MNYNTVAEYLAKGLQLPPLPKPPVAVPPGTYCSISGQPIEVGYPVSAMVTDATAEFLDCFRGGVDGYVSEAAARCFKSSNPRVGNPCARPFLAFEDTLYMPTIARDSPAGLPQVLIDNGIDIERPCWSELVRNVWPARQGQQCLVMLTTDTKKRLWIRARIGALGSKTPVFCYDTDTMTDRILWIDWGRLIQCLDLVEQVYTLGFSKMAIRDFLFLASKAATEVGLKETGRLEQALRAWRGTDIFCMATLIAQKAPEREGEPKCQK